MAIEIEVAHQLALEAIARGKSEGVELTSVDSLPGPAYGFQPHGWLLFFVSRRTSPRVGGGEYVAIHSESGEFRHLGLIGE